MYQCLIVSNVNNCRRINLGSWANDFAFIVSSLRSFVVSTLHIFVEGDILFCKKIRFFFSTWLYLGYDLCVFTEKTGQFYHSFNDVEFFLLSTL